MGLAIQFTVFELKSYCSHLFLLCLIQSDLILVRASVNEKVSVSPAGIARPGRRMTMNLFPSASYPKDK